MKIKIIIPLTLDEADLDDMGNMYEVKLPNGKIIEAFEDELS